MSDGPKDQGELLRELRFGGSISRVVLTDSVSIRNFTSDARTLAVYDQNTSAYVPSSAEVGVDVMPGEPGKRWTTVEAILKAAASSGFARDDRIAGIGGGVICDVAAFSASIYMRGCRLLLVPTTLLAMVDAAIGGKTGIDFGEAKNLVGTFYPAETVLIAPDCMSSLPEREYRSGLVEGLKHALLGEPSLLELFESEREAVDRGAPEAVEAIVRGSVRVKGDLVETDLRESGIRTHLNLGHTFGHALESATAFSMFTHGEAVAWGIGRALKLGLRLGITDSGYAARVWRVLGAYGYPVRCDDVDAERVVERMRYDKKQRNRRLRFVVQRDLGVTELVHADDQLVREVLADDSSIE